MKPPNLLPIIYGLIAFSSFPLVGASQLVGNVGFSIILIAFLKVRHKVIGSRGLYKFPREYDSAINEGLVFGSTSFGIWQTEVKAESGIDGILGVLRTGLKLV